MSVCVCMCMCVCACVYMYINMYTCVHIYECIYGMHICVCMCIYTFIFICLLNQFLAHIECLVRGSS